MWEATWPNGKGEQSHVSFSVKEHGEGRARQLAVLAREEALETIDGYFWACERGV
ncbi:hypothetical protein C0039_15490 [Pseudohalioglobus lutimaris]|uniref:Uncharacterized protein n=1 Tax=Pseudohalioglobus lutimaris TaxID=1737061 RepID=A0A2N5X000_9GAMM|nr:hypothetical protein C0039_15490 [Pseudohalioglobus lutimaris]